MNDVRSSATPVMRYVLAVLAAMIAIILAILPLVYVFDFTPPSSSGQFTTLVSTVVGVSWFARRLNRPMVNSERLWFASGVTLVNAVVPGLYAAIALLIVGLPLNLESIDLVFG